MKESPEFLLANSLIAHLRSEVDLAEYVLDEPWSRNEQAAKIALAARSAGIAITVCPDWPTTDPAATDTARILRANLNVAVISTTNLPARHAAGKLEAAVSRTIAAILSWQHENTRGFPYTEARIESVGNLDLSQYQDFQNLEGAILHISKPVSYKQYYATSGAAAELSK